VGRPADGDVVLIARVGDIACALPIASVIETMRPLPISHLGDAPSFVRGIAIVRAAPTVVIDTAVMLGIAPAPPARFVTVRADEGALALTFDEVVAVTRIPRPALLDVPTLLRASTREAVAALGRVEGGMLVLVETARILSREQWLRLIAGASA